MRVNYKGAEENLRRLAEISFDDEKETTLFERTAKLMEIKGYSIDLLADGYAQCVVEDRDDYNEFMAKFKSAKKCIKECIKFGF